MIRPSLEDKKKFLTWFIQNFQLKRRESLWILNYLLNHELLLKNVHFIEGISLTNRGMGLSTIDSEEEPFVYYKEGKRFDDPEQAFHDLRLNWKEDFYLELFFEGSYPTLCSFGIMENNPYETDEVTISKEKRQEIEISLLRLAWQERKRQLLKLIDQALVEQDEDSFREYTNELREIEQKI